MAHRTHLNKCGLLLGYALAVSGCGGTSKTERAQAQPEPEAVEDLGGNPADCDAEKPYDIEWVETWESGSGAWYTNNDICEPCNDLQTDLDTFGRMESCYRAMETAIAEYASTSSSNTPDAGAALPTSASDASLGGLAEIVAGLSANCPEDPRIDPTSDTLLADIQARIQEQVTSSEEANAELANCRPPCEASQTPSFFLDVMAASSIVGGSRCNSRFALNVNTVPLEQWGLTVGKQYALTAPKDLSDFDGILFWARRGPNSPSDLKVSLADPNTEERALREDGTPPCTYNAPYDDSSEGCDKFGKIVKLTEDWQLFVVPFKEMRQEGFGKIAPYLALDSILGISFDTKPGDHDLWIDDVGFYTHE